MLQRDWTFEPQPPPAWVQRRRFTAWVLRSRPLPDARVLKAPTPARRWLAYFAWLPDGRLLPHHRFTLQRLREQGLPLLVVAAAPSAPQLPPELHALADALVWKDLPGYDFSAYRLALDLLAQQSTGCDVLLFNDSVFGPFADLPAFIDRARWSLSGFTASSAYGRHLQSYALVLRDVRPSLLQALAPLFPFGRCLQHFDDVVLAQEVQLARVLARRMSVGSFWFSEGNPTLTHPFELLDDGFPFIKRALFDKHRALQEPGRVVHRLRQNGHPIAP